MKVMISKANVIFSIHFQKFCLCAQANQKLMSFVWDDTIKCVNQCYYRARQMEIAAVENYKGLYQQYRIGHSKVILIKSVKTILFSSSHIPKTVAFLHFGNRSCMSKLDLTVLMLTDKNRCCFVCTPHLFVGDGDESVFGKLSHDIEVCPHVQLAANQHHFGVWTELLRLPLPLYINRHIHMSGTLWIRHRFNWGYR